LGRVLHDVTSRPAKVALIDNGSLEPAAQRNLRAVAAALSERAGVPVAAVSWKHSDRIPAAELDGTPAQTIGLWLRSQLAAGERRFVFIPFFISAQGSIGSALRTDIEALGRDAQGFSHTFTDGLSSGAGGPARVLAGVVASRVRETIAERGLGRPAVVVVDHGGPSRASADLRDRVADQARPDLGSAIGPLSAASMESPEGPEFAFNLPLLAGLLAKPGFNRGEVVIAPLFLSPGRHAGPAGDLARIAAAAEAGAPGLRTFFSGLVGTHPGIVEVLAETLRSALRDDGAPGGKEGGPPTPKRPATDF
jgi:sirohydrochlorin ferrochelatase